MSAATIIAQAFGEDAIEDIYGEVLGICMSTDERNKVQVSASSLRKAYYRRALEFHPDKQTGKPSEEVKMAKLKFQAVSVAYNILCDDDKRKLYDETGELDDGDDDGDGLSNNNKSGSNLWKEYFQTMFGKVTTNDIDAFTESYKCSEEEEKDVLKYYRQFEGNVDKMLECVMCSDAVDTQRWVEDYIQPAIERGDVEDYLENMKYKCDGTGRDDDEDEDGVENDEVDDLGDDDDDEDFDDEGDEDDDEETETEDEQDDEQDKRSPKRRRIDKSKSNTNASQKTKRSSKSPSRKNTKQKSTTRTKTTTKTTRKKKKNDSPAVSQDLIAAIRGRAGGGGGFGSVLAGLEERYAPKKKGKGKQKKKAQAQAQQYEDIPDDEFEKIQKRIDARRKGK